MVKDNTTVKIYEHGRLERVEDTTYVFIDIDGNRHIGILHDLSINEKEPYRVITIKHVDTMALIVDGYYIADYIMDAKLSVTNITNDVVTIYVNGKYNNTAVYQKGRVLGKDVINSYITSDNGVWIETSIGTVVYGNSIYQLPNIKLSNLGFKYCNNGILLYELGGDLFNEVGIMYKDIKHVNHIGEQVFNIDSNVVDLKMR